MMSFKDNLKREMALAGLSQYRLAMLSGVPQPTIQRALKGSNPQSHTIKKLAEAMKIPSSRLVDGEEKNKIAETAQTYSESKKPSNLLLKLKGKMTPRTHSTLERLADIDSRIGLSDQDIAIVEAIISRYEAK